MKMKDTDIKNIGGRFVTMVDSGAVGKVIKRDGDNYIIEIKDFNADLREMFITNPINNNN